MTLLRVNNSQLSNQALPCYGGLDQRKLPRLLKLTYLAAEMDTLKDVNHATALLTEVVN